MINNLESVVTEVTRLLRGSGHENAAQDVGRLVNQLLSSSPEKRAEIVEAINDRCHPKWLGDLNVQTASWEEWMRLLSEFMREASRV